MSWAGGRTRGGGRHDRGATLVEAAVAIPVVVLLLLGTIEFGFAWRDVNRVERSLQTAGRTGSSIGTGRYADYEIIRAVDAAVRGMSGAEVERVVVFRASGADGSVPPACMALDVTASPLASKGVPNTCNVYSAAQMRTESPMGFPGSTSCAGGSWDASFCPPTARSNVAPDLTYLGIHVRARYEPFTSIIPGPTLTIDRTTVYRLEPCVPTFQDC